jgi:hypothetical protein
MNSMLNNACISALLCGAVIVAVPAYSQTVGAGPTGAISGPTETTATGTVNTATATNPPRSFAQNNNAGASVSTGGVSATGDVNSADASNNAASVNHSTQSSTTGSAGAAAH